MWSGNEHRHVFAVGDLKVFIQGGVPGVPSGHREKL